MKLFLQMSLMAGILILLVTVIRAAAINRLPKRCFVWLWAIVILRLLIPVSVDVEIRGLSQDSAVFAARRAIEHIIPPEQAGAGLGDTGRGVTGQGSTRLADTVRAGRTEGVITVSGNTDGEKSMPEESGAGFSMKADDPAAGTDIQNKAGGFGVIWKRWGWSLILAAGSIICFVIYLIRYIRGYRLLLEAIPLKGEAWENMCSRGNGSKRIALLVSDRIATPVTFGVLKPRIVLPKGMLAAGKEQLEYILQHEMVHIKRHDNLLIFAGGCAACIHWFNPLVWLMRALLVRDIEISCDEKVIAGLGSSQKAGYAISLIEAAGKTKGQPAMFSAFGKTAIQERIISIMKYKKTSIISISAAVLLTISSLTVFASAKEDSSVSYVTPVKTEAADEGQAMGSTLLKENVQENGTVQMKEGTQEKNETFLVEGSGTNAATLRENTNLIPVKESGTAEEAAALVEDYAGKLEALQEKMETANTENGDYDKYKKEYDTMRSEYEAAVEDYIMKDIAEAADEYGKYGLTYDEESGCFYLDGEPVRCIEDGACGGSMLKGYICRKENGTVDVSICRDENHNITGIEHCTAGNAGTGKGHHSEKHDGEGWHMSEHEHGHAYGIDNTIQELN